MADEAHFLRPSAGERFFNRLFGIALACGIGLRHNYVVEVRGRKTGRTFSTPVDLLEFNGCRYLVAPRGETNWVRNARAAGRAALRKGRVREEFALREVAIGERAELLKAYLDRFAMTVQRYFPVTRGAPAYAFSPIAGRYPVFELLPLAGDRAHA
jgi:deazaflavin-dependent oxidoreductase (nitroreductase family)